MQITSTCESTFGFYFDGTRECQREDGHKGAHTHHDPTPFYHDGSGRWFSWTRGGAQSWSDNFPTEECPQCGAAHNTQGHHNTAPGKPCWTCQHWDGCVREYTQGKFMVIEGTIYSWGPGHGFGGRTFTITDANGTVTRKGLWCGGEIPPEYLDRMPDTAAFGDTFPKEEAGD